MILDPSELVLVEIEPERTIGEDFDAGYFQTCTLTLSDAFHTVSQSLRGIHALEAIRDQLRRFQEHFNSA